MIACNVFKMIEPRNYIFDQKPNICLGTTQGSSQSAHIWRNERRFWLVLNCQEGQCWHGWEGLLHMIMSRFLIVVHIHIIMLMNAHCSCCLRKKIFNENCFIQKSGISTKCEVHETRGKEDIQLAEPSDCYRFVVLTSCIQVTCVLP